MKRDFLFYRKLLGNGRADKVRQYQPVCSNCERCHTAFLHNKNFRALIFTLIILSVMSVLSLGKESVVSSAINSVTKGLFQVTASATASADSVSYEELKAENEKLKLENAELREQLVDYYDVKIENKKLWDYCEIKKKNPSYKISLANVIKRDANDDFYSFTLDIGSSSGVALNNPVITEQGLVGWVCWVDISTCKVKTILSPETKAGAVDKQSSDKGIISGSAGLCDDNLTRLDKIAENNQIKVGDIIVTSGHGGIYPKNLIVGKVKELRVNSYDTTRFAIVEPYADIRTISFAGVITDFDGKGEIEGKK